MPSRTTLRLRILRLVIGMLLLVSLTISGAVWFSTDSQLREQIDNELNVADQVVRNTLSTREAQLIQAAQVLTADYGFKQAVTSGDVETIVSALSNHGERIGADLLAHLSLDGKVVASSSSSLQTHSDFSAPRLLQNAIEAEGASSFLGIEGRLFQVILLPVRAPDEVGVAVIGFHIDSSLVEDLQNISRLDISFVYENSANNHPLAISTLSQAALQKVLKSPVSTLGFRLPFYTSDEYLTREISLSSSPETHLRVLLSLSEDAVHQQYDALKFEIFIISILGILVSLLFGSVFASNISFPLQLLADAARRIASGDYQHRVDAGRSSQEVHDLNSAFVTMQTDLRLREERIAYQSHHDPLTGLLNRQRAIELIDDIIQHQPTTAHAAIAINTRDFRQINETFGYAVGDEYLRQLAGRMQRFTLNGALCARLGGDEFLVFLPVLGDLNARVRELAQQLDPPYQIKGMELRVNYRFATAQYPQDAQTAAVLLNKSDVAVDIARQRKLNLFHYEAAIEEARQQRLQIISDLRVALAANDGQLQMYYQPKICLRTGLPLRFEALIRWIHPSRGFISPDSFIPLAEQSGLIQALTDFVVATVIHQLDQWHHQDMPCTVAVNLSAQDVARPTLLDFILVELSARRLPRSCFSIEITESDIMSEPEKAIALLQRYRSEGISVAIDDFGTGFSSLSQLKNMPVNELKIDKGFVLQLANTENDQIIVRSTLELAHRFGLEVVAEGVETRESLALLQAWGCEWAQGYYFSKPLKAGDVPAWMQAYRSSDKFVVNLR